MDDAHCEVVYATNAWLESVSVAALPSITVGDALAAARRELLRRAPEHAAVIPWDSAPVGIHGRVCDRSTAVQPGDRIEIYRPLPADPREERRKRVRAGPKQPRPVSR
jgi:hypothetical protein